MWRILEERVNFSPPSCQSTSYVSSSLPTSDIWPTQNRSSLSTAPPSLISLTSSRDTLPSWWRPSKPTQLCSKRFSTISVSSSLQPKPSLLTPRVRCHRSHLTLKSYPPVPQPGTEGSLSTLYVEDAPEASSTIGPIASDRPTAYPTTSSEDSSL